MMSQSTKQKLEELKRKLYRLVDDLAAKGVDIDLDVWQMTISAEEEVLASESCRRSDMFIRYAEVASRLYSITDKINKAYKEGKLSFEEASEAKWFVHETAAEYHYIMFDNLEKRCGCRFKYA